MARKGSGKKSLIGPKRKAKAYPASQLREFRQAILHLREAAVSDVKTLEETLTTAVRKEDAGVFEQEVSFIERSSHGSAIAESAEMIRRQMQLIKRLDAALERVESGTYGICRTCGKPIGRMRLLAVPHTQECIACKSGANAPAAPQPRSTSLRT